ncbi:LOW QUALITY PROTEIN: hypothetical protein PanWU01x14_214980, partial [Parasponia andersonii]
IEQENVYICTYTYIILLIGRSLERILGFNFCFERGLNAQFLSLKEVELLLQILV